MSSDTPAPIRLPGGFTATTPSTAATAPPRPGEARLRILAAATLMPGFSGTRMPEWIADALASGVGSVCIYGGNVASPAQLATLTARLRAASPDLLLALDEEGGDVTRLHYLTGSNQPGNALLGRIDDVSSTEACAASTAAELVALGFNLNLAPDADVNSTAANPVIGVRSFGADAALVARHTAAFTTGLQRAGVAACAKHFPGHGDTATDSHLSLPTIDVDEHTLRSRELVPFAAAIAAGTACIMTSHIVVPVLDAENPATFSRAILQDLLRGELGFDGAVITDALDMAGASAATGIEAAAVRALAAGADLLCLGSQTSAKHYAGVLVAIVDAVYAGELPAGRLGDAARRVAALAAGHRPRAAGSPVPAAEAEEVPARGGAAGSVPDAAAIAAAFDIGPAARAWLADPAPPLLIQVESEANMAVGRVPWGPASVGAAGTLKHADPSAKIALVGRGLDAHHRIWQIADELRADARTLITVECGWPRGGADLVTFGASRTVSRALVGLLAPGPAGMPGHDRDTL